MYLIVALIFIPLGVVIFIQSRRMVRTDRIRYDASGDCAIGPGPFNDTNPPPEGVCTVSFTLEKDLPAPSYLYYGLVNFYQNARTYVESRSFDQLRGNEISSADAKEQCDPLSAGPNGTVLFPCGLIAQSRFNDSFELCEDMGCVNKVPLNGTNISWDIDLERRFRPSDRNITEENDLVIDEDFIVWMRVATYRNWKKLYRRIETDLKAGTYHMRATSRYPVEGFGGQKFFLLSETTWFGGPNEVLGVSYIAVGGVTLVLALAFFIRSHASQDLDLPPETAISLEGLIAERKYGPGPSGSGPVGIA